MFYILGGVTIGKRKEQSPSKWQLETQNQCKFLCGTDKIKGEIHDESQLLWFGN